MGTTLKEVLELLAIIMDPKEMARRNSHHKNRLHQKLVGAMEQRKGSLGLVCLLLSLSALTNLVTHSEARSLRRSKNSLRSNHVRKPSTNKPVNAFRRFETFSSSDPFSNYYFTPPNSLPPYEDVMGPSSSPGINPPFCVYPPSTPMPPSTTLPTPILPLVSPPPPPQTIYNTPPTITPNPPEYSAPSPPEYNPTPPTYVPSPPEYEPNPPVIFPSPPEYEPSPPQYVPGPPEYFPGPPIFLPPIVYPPPSVPPPPYTGTTPALWCVAKPTVPDPIIQEAMNYACGSGADCDAIQPNGSCYQPDTLIAHASFAFNSYWQRTKVAGGTCDFGGTAILITKDPSYDGCHFTFI